MNGFDGVAEGLHAIVAHVDSELVATQIAEAGDLEGGVDADRLAAAELGYFEAELKSLRQAAVRLTPRLPPD